jgi:asparagine synthase (glutamine-hydrolysing)
MCGIAGFIQTGGQPEPAGVLASMAEAIRHRGPDGNGYFRDRHARLAHLRLSIIDLATGQQPMSSEDGRRWIIYNGEVFNHAALRPELERAGHRYKSHSDTETILHAYEEYGPDCVSRFRGMFAFVIWDQDSRTLFAARDRLGIKPFYYYWDGSLLAFASEIKALFAHPEISPRLDATLVAEYLGFGYTSGERTLFENIGRLLPGHTLRLQTGTDGPKLEIRRYWDVPAAGEPVQRSDAEWIQDCRQRLEETVRMRLMSDVPLGMFLSGGLDSSAIAAIMKRQVKTPVQTFAVGYEEAAYSELAYARQVAGTIGTEHREVVVGSQEFFQALPKLIWHEDEPIAWPSSVSLYFVSQLAAKHVKVVLTGEGSDELFGGYSRYHFYQLNRRGNQFYGVVPQGIRRLVQSQIASSPLLSAGLRRKLGHTFLGREATLESLYLDNFYSGFSREEQARLFRLPSGSGGGV